jgi:hypothetical protein
MKIHVFKYRLGQRVRVLPRLETGRIVARAEYDNHQDHFAVRVADRKNGGFTQVWWGEASLEPFRRTRRRLARVSCRIALAGEDQ